MGDPKPLIEKKASVRLPTRFGEFELRLYHEPGSGKDHLALLSGDLTGVENVLIRIHSECLTGDIFHSLRCDCGPQLEHALEKISEQKPGAVLYLRQEGRGIGLLEKLKAYALQDQGLDTVEANEQLGHEADGRDYAIAVEILKDLAPQSIRLITNNPKKVSSLQEAGYQVTREESPLNIQAENRQYLKTKVEKMQHMVKDPII